MPSYLVMGRERTFQIFYSEFFSSEFEPRTASDWMSFECGRENALKRPSVHRNGFYSEISQK
jgi:hypothetical protein